MTQMLLGDPPFTKLISLQSLHAAICNGRSHGVHLRAHGVLMQTFYLTERHCRMLKEEEGIEAWCFEQHGDEAVFIPAGCPHQVLSLDLLNQDLIEGRTLGHL